MMVDVFESYYNGLYRDYRVYIGVILVMACLGFVEGKVCCG